MEMPLVLTIFKKRQINSTKKFPLHSVMNIFNMGLIKNTKALILISLELIMRI
jgi:hypothetical protein